MCARARVCVCVCVCVCVMHSPMMQLHSMSNRWHCRNYNVGQMEGMGSECRRKEEGRRLRRILSQCLINNCGIKIYVCMWGGGGPDVGVL